MEVKSKVITVYVSDDNIEFDTKKNCIIHDNFLKFSKLHEALIKLDFYKRFKIKPYFHNSDVTNISPRSELIKGDNNFIYYVLVRGRMGNGNDIIRFKFRKNHILILKCDTDDVRNQEYIGKIPTTWLNKTSDEISYDVEKYLSQRKVVIKVVTNTETVTYKEV